MRVAIVALGPSGMGFSRFVEASGHYARQYDWLYLINGFVNVFWPPNGRAIGFAMDDVEIQRRRGEEANNHKIAYLLESYKDHPGTIYTSREYPEYPALKAFPLEQIVNETGSRYFNNTVAYAIAYAICAEKFGIQPEPTESITIFGADYTYPDRHMAEEGRGCTEHWLGIAKGRGIKLFPAKDSQILDANKPDQPYGYDTQDVIYERQADGTVKVSFKDKEEIPTGHEMEQRYYKGDGSKKEAA